MLGYLVKQERMARGISQETLCKGICAPSYLSKIENGQVECSQEITSRLLRALGIDFVEDEEALGRFDALFARWWERFAALEPENKAQQEELASLSRRLVHSPRCIDANLLLGYARYDHVRLKTVQSLSVYSQAFTPLQAYQFGLLEAAAWQNEGNHGQCLRILERLKNDEEPSSYHTLAYSAFLAGEYEKAIQAARKAYALYSNRGLVYAMMDSALLLSNAHSNRLELSLSRRWLDTVERLNRWVKDPYLNYIVAYNAGTSQLMAGTNDGADRLLKKAVALCRRLPDSSRQIPLALQKYALACVMAGKGSQAQEALRELEGCPQDDLIAASVRLLRHMTSCDDYLHTKEYIALLEECFFAAQAQNPRGKMEFFGRFLLDAYKANRQYKSALALMEQHSLSHFI